MFRNYSKNLNFTKSCLPSEKCLNQDWMNIIFWLEYSNMRYFWRFSNTVITSMCIWQQTSCRNHTYFGSIFKPIQNIFTILKKWDFFSDFQNTVVRVYCLCIIRRTQRRKVFAWKTLLHDESLFLSPFLPESKVNKMRHSVLSTEQWSMTHTLISAENVCKMKRWKMRHFAAWHVMHSLIVNDPSPNNLQLLK